MSSNRRHHPQVTRAKEMARAAGLDPYAPIERRNNWPGTEPMYRRFMDAAFDEHFEREAVDNIYWDQGGSFYYGWADTEEQAFLDGTAAIKRLAAGRRVIAHYFHHIASSKLKEINTERRKARPPSDATDSKRIEYLYGSGPRRFQIIKKTAKRVYYLKQGEPIDKHGEPTSDSIRSLYDDGIGFVDRQKLEATGKVHYLYASLQNYLGEWHREDKPPPDLRQLKAAMAAAHPDRGGSSAAFIAARQAYVAARRRLRDQGRDAS